MPIRLTLLERLLARLNLLPMPLLDTLLSEGIARVLIVASELGVFDALSKGPLTREALAEQLRCSPNGLQYLLQLLVASGYIREKHGTYRNSAVARRWLTHKSSLNIAPYVMHSPDIVAIWDHLPEVVREGRQVIPTPYEEDMTKPENRALVARHYEALASLALLLGRELVWRVQLPPRATQLLDIGGSHAAYSVLFCRKYRQLQATIVDIQVGIEAGKRTALQKGLGDRLSFICADIVRDDFPASLPLNGSYDVALYFHIAHLLSAEINVEVLTKVAKTLRPGGLLVYVDQVTDQTHHSQLASLMVQLMAVTTTSIGGTCYSFPTVKVWLEQAGMHKVESHRLLTPGATLITARKMA